MVRKERIQIDMGVIILKDECFKLKLVDFMLCEFVNKIDLVQFHLIENLQVIDKVANLTEMLEHFQNTQLPDVFFQFLFERSGIRERVKGNMLLD